MCVVAVCEHVRLTDEQVEQMYNDNNFGGGAAWHDLSEVDGYPVVKWKKWLDVNEMKELNRTLPLPFVLHFRVPSGDASKAPQACHPFAINHEAEFALTGETEGFVLFHNGHWTGWKDKVQQLALSGAKHIPSGPWSDSRAMAWVASHLGLGFLEMANEKVVAFGPDRQDIELFGQWLWIKNKDEQGEEQVIYVSNKGWEKTFRGPMNTGTTVTDHRRTSIAVLANEQAAGAAHHGTFRGPYGLPQVGAGAGHHLQEAVQEEEAGPFWQDVAKLCAGDGCQKRTRSGFESGGKFYCMQCWSQVHGGGGLWGTCEVCKVEKATSKRYDTDTWICYTCWNTNGTPRVKFMLSRQEAYD